MADGGASSLLLGEGTRIARNLLSRGADYASGKDGGNNGGGGGRTGTGAVAGGGGGSVAESLLKTGLVVAGGIALSYISTRMTTPTGSTQVDDDDQQPNQQPNQHRPAPLQTDLAQAAAGQSPASPTVGADPPHSPNTAAAAAATQAPNGAVAAAAAGPSSPTRQHRSSRHDSHYQQQQQRVQPPPPLVRAKKVGHSPWVEIAVLGQGANGIVYKGINIETGQIVAIKVMMNAAGDRELRREMEILRHLRHPNLVEIIAFEVMPASQVALRGQGTCRLVQTLCGNGTLDDLQKLTGAVPELRLKEYARQLLSGMMALHENQPIIIHRDIKPANCLVSENGTLKIADFGLSRFAHTMRDVTRLAGTPLFLAPEAVRGHFSVGSDIWAVGCTLVSLLTNKRPWTGQAPMDNNASLMFYLSSVPTDPAARKKHRPAIADGLLSVAGIDFFNIVFDVDYNQRGTCRSLLQHPWLSLAGQQLSPAPVPADAAATAAVGGPATTASSPVNAGAAAAAAAASNMAVPAANGASNNTSTTKGSTFTSGGGGADEDDDEEESETSSQYDFSDDYLSSLETSDAQKHQQQPAPPQHLRPPVRQGDPQSTATPTN